MKKIVVAMLLILVMGIVSTQTVSAEDNEIPNNTVFGTHHIAHDYCNNGGDNTISPNVPPSRGCLIILTIENEMLCTDKPASHCTDCVRIEILQSCVLPTHIIHVSYKHTKGGHSTSFNSTVGVFCVRCGYVLVPV